MFKTPGKIFLSATVCFFMKHYSRGTHNPKKLLSVCSLLRPFCFPHRRVSRWFSLAKLWDIIDWKLCNHIQYYPIGLIWKKSRKEVGRKGGISLLPLGFPVVRREIQDEVRGGKAEYIRTVNIWGNYFLSIQMDFSHTLLWNPMTNFPEWSHAKRVVNYLFSTLLALLTEGLASILC